MRPRDVLVVPGLRGWSRGLVSGSWHEAELEKLRGLPPDFDHRCVFVGESERC